MNLVSELDLPGPVVDGLQPSGVEGSCEMDKFLIVRSGPVRVSPDRDCTPGVSSGLRCRDPGLQAGEGTPLAAFRCGIIERVCDNQAGTSVTRHGTAAGHAVAARGGDRVTWPVNREPTAQRELRLESPAFWRVEDARSRSTRPRRV